MESKLDLITINNFLVKLRKPIDRSRVQIINKLTRQIAHFKGKKGTKEQLLKNERKVERLRKEIQIMAKLHKNDIAKFAIVNTQKCLEDTINPEAMSQVEIDMKLRKRALLRISNHSLIDKELSLFRTQHPTWETDLEEMLPILGEKSRLKKEKEKLLKKKLKRKKRQQLKREENLDFGEAPNVDGSDDEKEFVSSLRSLIKKTKDGTNSDSSENEDSDSDSEDENDIPAESDFKKNGLKIQKQGKKGVKNTIAMKSKGENGSSDSEDHDPHVVSDSKEKVVKVVKHQGKHLKRKDKELVIKPISLTEATDDSESSEDTGSDEESDPLDNQSASNVAKIKDSFFLGGDSDSESENSDSNLPQEESQNGKKGNNKPLARGVPRHQQGRGGGHSSTSGRGRGMGKFATTSRDERPLHPSWQAKRSHQSSIAAFNGKKTKFDDVGDAIQEASNNPKPQNIHLSWAAKQNQKSDIVPFQGKKLKFDENNHGKPRESGLKDATVHPSWSAKQKQKVTIQDFQGKKIVFNTDDD